MNKNKGILALVFAIAAGTIGFVMTVLKISERKENKEVEVADEDNKVDFRITLGGGARYVNTEAFEYAYLKNRF